MHFFIDHTQLPAQTTSDLKFGPDATNPETKFNISTQFKLTIEAKAFACQDGMMIVQKNDDDPINLVNVIIKPSKSVVVNGIAVKYYFYRGIKLNSFFSLSGGSYIITPQNTSTNTEFITSFWRNIQKGNAQAIIPTPTPLNIGYGDNDQDLSASKPIKDIFNSKTSARAYPVKEGMWIGYFTTSTKIAFDIELESELKNVSTLSTCRFSAIQISTTNLSGLDIKQRKEFILNFIDPAAFFGAHAEIGVNTTTYTGVTKNSVLKKISQSSTNFYNDILSKFSNENRVYLDIRSERGLSYDFYDAYKIDSTNIRINGATTAIEYGSSCWPIMFFNTGSNHDSITNKISFRLSKKENTNPVLYFENKRFSAPQKQTYLFKGTDLIDADPLWTKNQILYYPHARNTARDNIANYIKLYYYVGNPVTTGTSRLLNKKYYDSAFCSIDLDDLGDPSIKNGHVENPNAIYIKEPLQSDGTGNFSYVAKSGAYWDANRILFYSKNTFKRTNDGSGKWYLNTYIRRLSLANSRFNREFKNLFNIVCKKYESVDGKKILGLNSYAWYNSEKKQNELQEKEDLILLGLSISEIQTLKNVQGLSLSHPRYIFLDPVNSNYLLDTDPKHYRYYKYNVKLQGLSTSGIPTIIIPTTPIVVYSRDNIFFNSKSFAASENYCFGNSYLGDSRIEFRIFRDGTIYLNDNIDLSLVRKKKINDLTLLNGNPNYTLINDFNDANSVSQQIHYLFYNMDGHSASITNQTPYQEFCQLEIIMENKRLTENPQGAEASASTTAIFTNLGYSQIFDYTPFNAAPHNVWALKSYQHTTNGNVITRGILKKDSNRNPIYGNKKYIKINKKIYLVFIDKNNVNSSLLINNRFDWYETVRYFAKPELFAAFLGALRDLAKTVKCGGFAYPDASSFPSYLHVNGEAFDTNYFSDIGGTITDDLDFIKALHKYGRGLFRIGPAKTSLRNQVNPTQNATTGIKWIEGGSLHNTHLHTENIVIGVK